MGTYRNRREREQEKSSKSLEVIYQLAASKVEFYQKQRYISIGFVTGLEVACLTGFSYLFHAPVNTVGSRLIVMMGYLFFPLLGELLLGALWLNENRLKDYYSESFWACIEIEAGLNLEIKLYTRLSLIPYKRILSLEHTAFFRWIIKIFAFGWIWALSFGVVESWYTWYK